MHLLVRVHEKVHSFLSPKPQGLREMRVVLSADGCVRPYILRYLEEALAEPVAQVDRAGLARGARGHHVPRQERLGDGRTKILSAEVAPRPTSPTANVARF